MTPTAPNNITQKDCLYLSASSAAYSRILKPTKCPTNTCQDCKVQYVDRLGLRNFCCLQLQMPQETAAKKMNRIDIDLWYDYLGLNVIPIYFKGKQCMVPWKEWQDKAIPEELYEKWKKNEFVNNNCAIITGKIHRGPHKGKYFVCIDLDNRVGIDEFLSWFGETKSLEELGQKTVVVQHEDAKGERAHIYFITEKPLGKKSGISGIDKDGKIPAIEVKSDSSTYVVCPPSIHQNGHPYQIVGTKEIQVLNDEKSRKLEDALNKIYEKYNNKNPPLHSKNDIDNGSI